MDSYICVDLETTGLNPKQDKIIEIGACKVIDGIVVERFETFVNPERKLEERIVELTGIRDEDLENAPTIEMILPQVLAFLEEWPLLGHSVLFDYSFLKKACVNQKIPFERRGLDTLKLARKYLADLEHRSLDYLCEYYKIPHHAHRALADAEATIAVYNLLTEQFYDEKEPLFTPHLLQFNVKRDCPATAHQKERLYKLLDLHKITPEIDVEKMTKSEASRYTDKILLTYGR